MSCPGEARRNRLRPDLASEQDPQVAQIIPRWSSFNFIAQCFKKRIGIEVFKRHVVVQSACLCTRQRSSIHDRPCSRTVAIDSIGSRAQHRDVLTSNLLSTSQRKLLVATANSVVRSEA